MRVAKPHAHPGGLGGRTREMVERLFPRPICAFCPGPASEFWTVDPFGHAHGVCGHCLERMRDLETARR